VAAQEENGNHENRDSFAIAIPGTWAGRLRQQRDAHNRATGNLHCHLDAVFSRYRDKYRSDRRTTCHAISTIAHEQHNHAGPKLYYYLIARLPCWGECSCMVA